ncbi:hypothetical protein BJ968_004259 [Kineococcus aurantiacus]|uniref:Uncharacterized protein n=1 Tax=Kineococcus aurantiacus TaxID=37633 RepID=A0A7Y9DQ76_9ACTN|nr:hypothetical protein [Kineococcus aurantiacus]
MGELVHPRAQDRGEQGFLVAEVVAEVVVDERLAAPGLDGDAVDPCSGDPGLGELLDRSAEDAVGGASCRTWPRPASAFRYLAWLGSVEKLRRIAREKDAEVVFGHDETQKTQLTFAPGGHRFEAGVASMSAPDPACPRCGAPAGRLPGRVHVGGAADAGVPRERVPRSWRGVAGGHPDAVAHWRRVVEHREGLEERHPELAGDRRPVLAHEGIFAGRPLRAGDDVPAAVAAASAAAGRTGTHGDRVPPTA